MKLGKSLVCLSIACIALFTSCNQTKSDNSSGNIVSTIKRIDSAGNAPMTTMVIANIPFPTNIFDTLHDAQVSYQASLLNPVESESLYSQSNLQAINLGVFGADLCYVIAFEQFQQVGNYMKACKYLTDKAGIPTAFTEQMMDRCQKNANNKDSLSRIVYQSYNIIDSTLKNDQRKSMEILVLAGGWVEGAYITTQGLSTMPNATDRQNAYRILIDQKHYLDQLLNQLDLVADSHYCQSISTSLHEIRGVFNSVSNAASINDELLKTLTEKISNLRILIVKGGNA